MERERLARKSFLTKVKSNRVNNRIHVEKIFAEMGEIVNKPFL